MADELTRDEVKERLEAIFSSSLEGKELDKALASIEKRLDKFEGKWGGLIKWAETKHGKPEESEEAPEAEEQSEPEESEEAPEAEEQAEPEDKPKKRGIFGAFRGKKKDPEPEVAQPESDSAEPEETPAEQPMSAAMSRDDATARLTAIFNSHLEGEELEKMLESIPQRLDKFEGKWPKLILWAEGKYGAAGLEEEESGQPEVEAKVDVESTLELIISGDTDSALSNLKQLLSEDSANPDVWRGASSYFSSLGMGGRSTACEEKAESLT